ALPRLLLDQLTICAQGTLHADEVLLHVLAVWISAARSEFTVAAVADHQIAPAGWARLVERNIRNFLALVEAPGGLAIRIPCARHELPEASTLQHHYAAAILTVLIRRSSFLQISGIEVRQIDGIFFGEGAAVRVVFVVRAASVERPVFTPL